MQQQQQQQQEWEEEEVVVVGPQPQSKRRRRNAPNAAAPAAAARAVHEHTRGRIRDGPRSQAQRTGAPSRAEPATVPVLRRSAQARQAGQNSRRSPFSGSAPWPKAERPAVEKDAVAQAPQKQRDATTNNGARPLPALCTGVRFLSPVTGRSSYSRSFASATASKQAVQNRTAFEKTRSRSVA